MIKRHIQLSLGVLIVTLVLTGCNLQQDFLTDDDYGSLGRNRYETPESVGECDVQDDCVAWGCGSEKCTAKKDSTGIGISTCEAATPSAAKECTCVDTRCVWTK